MEVDLIITVHYWHTGKSQAISFEKIDRDNFYLGDTFVVIKSEGNQIFYPFHAIESMNIINR